MFSETDRYNFHEVEERWLVNWKNNPIPKGTKKEKYYCLDMFPYPSDSGLHVGHWRGYVFSDVITRYKTMKGFEVLHPMGWDAFGLPAENYAIKEKIHPSVAVTKSITSIKRQLLDMGSMYDWDREISTTDPEFYKWTQWIFVKMFEAGLAYEQEMPLNWCENCKAVLANEEVVAGGCERCGNPVTKKKLRQWMLRITAYADRLLEDLQGLAWPAKAIKMQQDWIGKSYGAEVTFPVVDREEKINVFTTRPDTLFGATFMVLSPEHQLVNQITSEEFEAAVQAYQYEASLKSNVDRMASKEKTGVFTGAYAINPVSNEHIPIWIADYVLADYGTGAIMSVPAHDERDFDMAKLFGLPISQVISETGEEISLEEAYLGDGVLVNSGPYNGMESAEAIEKITADLETKGMGKKTVNYKLRDWVFSRQRYWGEPIPIIHCPDCKEVAVPVEDLPVKLPDVVSYEPTSTGESPLALIEEWVQVPCPKCGKPAKRETNTMPQWAGSSWYFIRYADPNNDLELASKEAIEAFLPVDYYVGGIEHAVLHLLYARFYTKFLYDIQVLPFTEPFKQLFNQGMVNRSGSKMSKSKGNGVSPDDMIAAYGRDSLRMYEMFIAPAEIDVEWDDQGIEGVYRFLGRVWRFFKGNINKNIPLSPQGEKTRHQMIETISKRVKHLTFNTAVSGLMEYFNHMEDIAKQENGFNHDFFKDFILLMAPFTPFIAEEMWASMGGKKSIFVSATWPTFDPEKAKEAMVTIAIQMNGKLRGTIEVAREATKETILPLAKEAVGDRLAGVTIIKEIVVPGRIVNFVVK